MNSKPSRFLYYFIAFLLLMMLFSGTFFLMMHTGERMSSALLVCYQLENDINYMLYTEEKGTPGESLPLEKLEDFSIESNYQQNWNLLKEYIVQLETGHLNAEESREMLQKARRQVNILQRLMELQLKTDWDGLKLLFLFFLFLILTLVLIFFFTMKRDIQNRTLIQMKETYKQQMIHQLEEERNLAAYHLHDDLAQSLVFIQSYLESTNEDYLRSKKDQAIYLSGEVLNSIRNLSRSLRAPKLYESGFNDTLKGLCEDINSLTTMKISYTFVGTANLNLEEDQFLHIYRITQELLNNGIKHSRGKNMNMRFLYSHPQLIMQYSDDGVGLKPPESRKVERRKRQRNLGMTGMEYRCRILNASSSFTTGPQGGVLVRIEIPLKDVRT